jgi:RNA polymerase sigma factor (sigma-70 family)
LVDDSQLKACPDEQLLSRFIHQNDESAFQVLLRRHGPMVLDVCTSLLPNEADAEDAFQACFLLLASRARTIRKAKSLAAWLHGVAYRVARKARTEFARRQKHEGRRAAPDETIPADDLSWREVRQLVHEELNLLPQRYRQVLTLCYLQGKRQDEVARELGIPGGTLKGRLERGRHMLRTRLVRRGLGPGASLIAMVWPACETSGHAHAACVTTTVRAAMGLAARKGITGLVSPRVAGLVTGALNAMLVSKTIIHVAAIGLLVAMGYAFSLLAGAGAVQPSQNQQGVGGDRSVNPAPEGEKDPGWVKSEDGVLALRFTIKPGEPFELTASLRNLSDKPVNVLRPFGDETAARMAWIDIRGPQGQLKCNIPHEDNNHPLVFTRLEPGETIKDTLKIDSSQYLGLHRPGRYTITFEYTFEGNGDKVAEQQGLLNVWRGKIRSKPVVLTVKEDLEGWVKSADGVLALRLTGGAGKPEEPIQIIVSLRNRSDRPVNVLRPCGDDYQARSVFVELKGPGGKFKYTGPNPTYTLGKQAFFTLSPGDTISDPLAITVDNRQGSDVAGEYRVTFTYEATASNRTWADKQHGLPDLWTGRIQSQTITVRKGDGPALPTKVDEAGLRDVVLAGPVCAAVCRTLEPGAIAEHANSRTVQVRQAIEVEEVLAGFKLQGRVSLHYHRELPDVTHAVDRRFICVMHPRFDGRFGAASMLADTEEMRAAIKKLAPERAGRDAAHVKQWLDALARKNIPGSFNFHIEHHDHANPKTAFTSLLIRDYPGWDQRFIHYPAVTIDAAVRKKLIVHLAADGFFLKGLSDLGKNIPPPMEPSYTFRLTADNGKVSLLEVAGWGPPLVERLRRLRDALGGEAGKEIDRIVSQLDGDRPSTPATPRQGAP